ncbi:MAG: hypothetical protein KF726_18175 [Anaerolineae bacterium]|nr:hypothetical protein [Anaerolineae bacterium]
MKKLRRLALAISLICALISIVLLLNFTAPNPTGRRYSSEIPLTTGQGRAQEIGSDGERVLAQDLRLPNNNDADQLKCICNSGQPDPNQCSVCLANVTMQSPFRRPDFIGTNFIAEVKNAQNLLYDSRDLEQIRDYALAAKAMGQPLWLYTRVNTNFDAEFERLVNETGGGVVRYLTVSGYVDPVDETARSVLGWALLIGVITGAWEIGSRRGTGAPSGDQTLVRSTHPLTKAIDSVDRAEQFKQQYKDRLRDKLD